MEQSSGATVFVNPRDVSYLEPDPKDELYTLMSLQSGKEVEILGTPGEVVLILDGD